MDTNGDDAVVCPTCEQEVDLSDQFCTRCGTLLSEGVTCRLHPSIEAAAVCVICSTPCCESCGEMIAGVFRCNDHLEYDIIDGMVEVFPAQDDTMAHYVNACLLQAGLHPFELRSRGNDLDGHVVNSTRVMVPSQEVLEAEQIIGELDIPG